MSYYNDHGLLNNFAKEPKMYKAEAPSEAQQRNSIVLVALGLVLAGGLVGVAFFVTSIS
ncbi:MAG: ssl1498 family light-harvesting-like protein [Oscillatoria sp. SIO1A7]|nr:ssl1498 family light-harvesting-like protein [Oscillatoria sp. SIO1A7]